jgi:glycosyltransferase involved in cell wall biosynthesis
MSSLSDKLTVCVLTNNDSGRIEKAVDSIATLGSKILIVDAFSDDETFSKARSAWNEAGREFHDFEFIAHRELSLVNVRNLSLKYIKTRWIFWLDSDEWLDSDLVLWLKEHLEYLNPDYVYAFRRQTFFLGKAVRHGGWYPDYNARLCRVGHAEWRSGSGNIEALEFLESIASQSNIVRVDAHLGHLPFRSDQEQREIFERCSTAMATELCELWISKKVEPPGRLRQAFLVLSFFLNRYIIQLGFLDLKAGFLLSRGFAWAHRKRIEKARDLYWIKMQ